MPRRADIGIIGGSGLYEIEGLRGARSVKVKTPFGSPSDDYVLGNLEGVSVAFLARHGKGHRIMPSEINFRANIYGMKVLGVERILSVSAVGSMKEKIRPGDMVVPHQFYDHTRRRISTFFGEGVVAHVSFADPVCVELAQSIRLAGLVRGVTLHEGGTYLCIEGPQFSTRGESHIYRQWGVDVIGMTNVTEAKLAREAEICYATLALVTDYDCWHQGEEDVTAEAVVAILQKNVEMAKKVVRQCVLSVPKERACACGHALENA
ncbi:MAG: S-methyl-5'-thioadenosine phosphorylase, partial [Nitrospira sp.]|nr:S-methyl-5'-thioadenosine phosphorylase [Nitrospira sp.]